MNVVIGSARADENFRYSGGKRGDQRQKGKPDFSGEVSKQSFYVHRKGWYVLRFKKAKHAKACAKAMNYACDNGHLGYSQSDRYAIFNYKNVKNENIAYDTNCDCSSLVRKCVIDATGKDVGDFNTSNEASVLEASGLFEKRKIYTPGMTLYEGDILVTREKGHTVIVIQGATRKNSTTSTESKPVENISYTLGKKYTVQVDKLNMRSKPTVDAPIITTLTKGEKLTCRQIKVNGSETWMYNSAGWACAKTKTKIYIK